MWVIPLFGQAVNKRALHFLDAWGMGGWGGLGGLEDALNPADSLMIPPPRIGATGLCQYACSCVLFLLSENVCSY